MVALIQAIPSRLRLAIGAGGDFHCRFGLSRFVSSHRRLLDQTADGWVCVGGNARSCFHDYRKLLNRSRFLCLRPAAAWSRFDSRIGKNQRPPELDQGFHPSVNFNRLSSSKHYRDDAGRYFGQARKFAHLKELARRRYHSLLPCALILMGA